MSEIYIGPISQPVLQVISPTIEQQSILDRLINDGKSILI